MEIYVILHQVPHRVITEHTVQILLITEVQTQEVQRRFTELRKPGQAVLIRGVHLREAARRVTTAGHLLHPEVLHLAEAVQEVREAQADLHHRLRVEGNR